MNSWKYFYVILLVLSFISEFGWSQTTYVHTYTTPLKDVGKQIHIISDSSYILEGYRIDGNNWSTAEGILYLIDYYGNISITANYPYYVDNINNPDESISIFTGHTFDGKLVIGKITDTLSVDTLNKYTFSNVEIDLIDGYLVDSCYLSVGRMLEGSHSSVHLTLFHNLDTVKTKVLDIFQSGTYANTEIPYRALKANDTTSYICGSGAFVVKINHELDTVGVYRNENFSIQSNVNRCLIIRSDTLIVLSQEVFGRGYVLSKFDLDLNLINSKSVSFFPNYEAEYFKIIESRDNGYYVIGYRKNGPSANDNQNISLLKLNSSFDTLWTKEYGGAFNDYGWDIITTEDSCLMILGETRTNTHENAVDVILIKTDLNGQITGGAGYVDSRNVMLKSYPNPVHSQFVLDFYTENTLRSIQFNVYSLEGKLIYSKALPDFQHSYTLDLGSLTSGTYIYELVDDIGQVRAGKIVKQ